MTTKFNRQKINTKPFNQTCNRLSQYSSLHTTHQKLKTRPLKQTCNKLFQCCPLHTARLLCLLNYRSKESNLKRCCISLRRLLPVLSQRPFSKPQSTKLLLQPRKQDKEATNKTRKTPRLQNKKAQGNTAIVKVQELLAKKCGIMQEEE